MSQKYPLGQQLTPLEQQTASGRGQHPYPPVLSLQQVLRLGHSETPSGHRAAVEEAINVIERKTANKNFMVFVYKKFRVMNA